MARRVPNSYNDVDKGTTWQDVFPTTTRTLVQRGKTCYEEFVDEKSQDLIKVLDKIRTLTGEIGSDQNNGPLPWYRDRAVNALRSHVRWLHCHATRGGPIIIQYLKAGLHSYSLCGELG